MAAGTVVSTGPFAMNELSKMERNNHGLVIPPANEHRQNIWHRFCARLSENFIIAADGCRETGQSENSNVYHSSTAQFFNTTTIRTKQQ